ncbi:hypothetical protein PVMG_02774 [Plasmodium vivax Mauritania I]|uniref:Uncharacterized protein n=1 Tax=Plasmodium vivax Mauritania I TaxID=1035515 RepID=A0A0J9T592_PLAVI|nr:hypothetical protein PVMG_02774 [Plasmodium vivax Mauritania I]
MFLSYGPLNVYSYRCSILSQYIKALNISTQQFKINEMKNHMKLKKTLSIFCNDSDNPLGKDSSSNCGSLSNVNEKEPFVSISHSKSSNSLTTFFKKSTFEETVFYSCEMNDSSSVYNRKSSGVPPHEGGSPNMELEHISGSADSIARLAPEAHPLSGVSGGVSNDVSNDLSNGVSNDLRNTPSNNPSNNVGNPPGDARPESPSNEPGKPPKRSGSALPGTERGKASKKSSPVISNFFPYPLNNMELFITKNNAGAKEVNDQDDMITLIHEILRSSNKDSYTYADFTRWYRNNVGKFSYTSQNVLKYCYKSIKDSYFVNVDVGYIKEKCKEIDEKYYRRGGTNDSCGKKGKEDYLKKMFHYVKSNYDYIKKIKCPFNTFFVGELNLDNLLNLNILDLLDCAFKVFFISYLNSVMNSKLIYIRKIQEVLASMFAIIKGIHRRGRGRRRSSRSRSSRKGERSGPGGERSGQNGEKNSRGGEESGQSGKKNSRGGDGNLGEATPPGCPNPSPALAKGARGKDPPGDDAGRRDPNSTVNLQDAAGDDSHPNVKGDHLAQERKSTAEKSSSVLRRETHGGSITPQGDTNRSSEGRRYYRVGAPNRDSTNHAAAIPSSGNPPHVKSQENVNDSERNSSDNVDFCYGGEQKTGYKNSFNINKEENYFKNFSKLFLLFETCEQMFNKAAWLYRIFNNSLNEKRIFNLINTILESEEKEIVINPKDQKYFYDFIKNICLSENSKNGAFGKSGPFGKSGALDKKWSGASGSKFHRINKSISSRHLNRTFKSKRERSERSEIGERGERSEIGEKGERSEKNDNSAGSAKNPVINNPYQNLGVSVKVKKNDSQPCPSASDEKNMLNKDKLSLLLHSHNKEQNIQECIIDYVDHSFGDPLYNPPARMYCSVNPVDTTVSFVKTTPIL